jgi:ABC-2 type transport system ATP-binding protein
MTASVLQLSGLEKRYGKGASAVHAVRGLNVTVEPGQVFAFLGPNGAGKTTTMHMILDFIRPTAGEARIFGIPSSDAAARKRLGFLPELFNFDTFLTGRETLLYYGRLSGVAEHELGARADKWLARLGLADAAHRRLATYSKGMMQRTGLAQALMGEPDLVMLDEPTSGMDPGGKRDVMDLFRELRAEGRTVFLSSHILADVEAVADSVAIIDKGLLRYEGPLGDILKREDFTLISFTAGDGANVTAHVPNAYQQDGLWHAEVEGEEGRRSLVDLIGKQGWDLHAAVPRRKGLDDAFLELLKPGPEESSA